MEKFGVALCIIGFLFLICLLGYVLYISVGQTGAVVYVSILCLAIICIVMSID